MNAQFTQNSDQLLHRISGDADMPIVLYLPGVDPHNKIQMTNKVCGCQARVTLCDEHSFGVDFGTTECNSL